MRLITRRGGESFHIGNGIKVTLVSVRGKEVELSIGTLMSPPNTVNHCKSVTILISRSFRLEITWRG
ncbi:MAG: carbon storage regulator [Planctomycetota bacterium]